MPDLMQKIILSKYPNYDLSRYHFKFGDIIKLDNYAKVFVVASAIEYIEAYVLRAGFGMNRFVRITISYDDLPYYKKGEFINSSLRVSKSLYWRAGIVVIDPRNNCKLLLENEKGVGFEALILDSKIPSLIETRVYVLQSPYRNYITRRR